MLSEEKILILALVINIAVISLVNYFGQAITKYINAVTRMLISAVRATVVWTFGIIITVA